ncbi:DNA polymerase III subunit gamma and tau [Leifsonia sp. AK011]|uniref:DNA polymerase III subunit gamma and tau n=1 Tax=Leifsonia sp. AK011 TaxID=2723075 RepID=UPI0015C9B541
MVAALYRRYRPETFAELIGQSQVTDPLRTALRTDRVNHAYLFSGPRGCGKTTSARILARCLNCAEGPTDTPCGVCPSCVELSRDGSGSLDVVEIDAASHNGVDDARDLRERAVFAPARDRFKIFILDEAHMVTPQGFNALLKIVEEPPEHVKFIFATTEPEKVIGTIRSRTHHYPFRLVPPAQMLDYTQELCDSEGVTVDAGVLPLVVRAGGGSVRDTLSLLDQLIAGSEPSDGDDPSRASGSVRIEYERAVALLGYTHGALLDEVVEAIGARDNGAVFAALDRVIQTGQDPRRFVEDLLERLRDLIVVAATRGNAQSVLRGIPQDQLDRMTSQAQAFGSAELSRAADVVNAALSEMTGATSPRLHLELMAARILVPSSDETDRGALARVERLERRIGVLPVPEEAHSAVSKGTPAASATVAPSAATQPAMPDPAQSAGRGAADPVPPAGRGAADPVHSAGRGAADPVPPVGRGAAEPRLETSPPSTTAHTDAAIPDDAEAPEPDAPEPTASEAAGSTEPAEHGPAGTGVAGSLRDPHSSSAPVTIQQVKDAWPEILEVIENAKRTAWMVVATAKPLELRDGNVLVISFPSQNDVVALKQQSAPGEGVGDHLKKAMVQVLGIEPLLIARVAETPESRAAETKKDARPTDAAPQPATSSSGWTVAKIPGSSDAEPAPVVDINSTPASRAARRPEAQPTPGGRGAAEAPAPGGRGAAEPRLETSPPSNERPSDERPTDANATDTNASAPSEPAEAPASRTKAAPPAPSKYGESVVRDVLGATFIEEQPFTPRVIPRDD